ncbi:MAG: universal stress protein [Gammaproteobacteria bacterium]|nr:universal stress protein [Gammaproteobacteria bacterium]
MANQASEVAVKKPQPGNYQNILNALDSSDHSNRALSDAVSLAGLSGARLTGTHVYAAKLHDVRFRQMEGGLPEQFRQEQELERQRDVHDDLITRGLSIITDSYLDQADRLCRQQQVPFLRSSLEGKNYRALVEEANKGKYDLLVMGALGLGAVAGSRIGTVCERVVRRVDIDTLVIKNPQQEIAAGPVVVAIDGSTRAYGGLLTALALAKKWGVPLHVISAFDPYYHYVAFNRIAGVLSEEAGKVFRFKDQEKLHEEIIDSGLAKIYQGHLSVAESIAEEHGAEVETVLLDGKPYDAIEKYLLQVKPSLLVIGKTGIHADPELDIGGNAENLLRNVECAVLLSQQEYQPAVDVMAEASMSWTTEAEKRMQNVPSFVRNMARMSILRYAQERGHTVITERIVEQATAQLMPGHAEQAMQEIVEAYDAGELKSPVSDEPIRWSDEATLLLRTVEDLSLRGNLSMRAEKKARAEKSGAVEAAHIRQFLQDTPVAESSLPQDQQGQPADNLELHWQAAATARLMRVPRGFMRNKSKQRIEHYALANSLTEITLETVEAGLAEARKAMGQSMDGGAGDAENPVQQQADTDKPSPSICPFGRIANMDGSAAGAVRGSVQAGENQAPELNWQQGARDRLRRVPRGYCRDMTVKAVESIASLSGCEEIDGDFVTQVMKTFKSGAETVNETMPWDSDARIRISRAPDMVRGMLIKEIEGWAQRNGDDRVDETAVEAVKEAWRSRGVFHLDPDDHRNGG